MYLNTDKENPEDAVGFNNYRENAWLDNEHAVECCWNDIHVNFFLIKRKADFEATARTGERGVERDITAHTARHGTTEG